MATENIQNIGNFTDGKYATGRRKKSIAKVWLKKGSGNIFVNGKKYDEYFKRSNHANQLLRPFELIEQSTNSSFKTLSSLHTDDPVFQSKSLTLCRFIDPKNPFKYPLDFLS